MKHALFDFTVTILLIVLAVLFFGDCVFDVITGFAWLYAVAMTAGICLCFYVGMALTRNLKQRDTSENEEQ